MKFFLCSKYVEIICKWLREWSLTVGVGRGGGGRAGKFWKRAAIFWAPIWGGLKFSERLWAMCAY